MPSFSKLFLSTIVFLIVASCWAGERSDPTRWEEKIVEIEKRHEALTAKDVEVVFVGSSSIRFWNLEKSFPDLKAINCGFGGSHLFDSTHFSDRLIKPFAPHTIVLYAGDNDIGSGLSVEETVNDFIDCVAAFRKARPGVRILYVAIKPSHKRWGKYPTMKSANKKIAALIEKDDNAAFVDIASAMLAGSEDGPPPQDLFMEDGLHLSEKGYAMWTELVANELSAVTEP